MKLLTIENAKTSKGAGFGYLTGILYLAPHRIADKNIDLCPNSTAGCRKACLYSAGRGKFKSIQEARIIKTLHFLNNKQGFIDQLKKDIEDVKKQAIKLNLKPCIRLNGTSDIDWQVEASILFETYPEVQFYDYTKDLTRRSKFKNYHITYSVSETNQSQCLELNKQGETIAIVKAGLNDYNGDQHDLRFLNKGEIVYLNPKGDAKKDSTGFVNRGQ